MSRTSSLSLSLLLHNLGGSSLNMKLKIQLGVRLNSLALLLQNRQCLIEILIILAAETAV